jgi:hypothetical protein
MKKLGTGIAIAVLGISLYSNAFATQSTYLFDGTVIQVDSTLSPYISVGTHYTGSMTLDSGTPDVSSFPVFHSDFDGGLISGIVHIGPYTFTATNGDVQVQPPPRQTMWNAIAGPATGLGGTISGSIGGRLYPTWWNYQAVSFSSTLFTTTAFPQPALITNLSAFQSREFDMLFTDGQYNHTLSATINTTIPAPAPVPEPGTLSMLAVGATLIGWRRRKYRTVLRRTTHI